MEKPTLAPRQTISKHKGNPLAETTQTPDQYLKWFRNSSPYINAHRKKTFVLVLSGETLGHANFYNIIHDIALLSHLGVRLVLVHGARPQINQQLKKANIASQFRGRKRITCIESLPHVLTSIGSLRIQIEAALSMSMANSPMHGARIRVVSGNFVIAKPLGIIDGLDFHHSGEVRRIDHQGIDKALEDGDIVLLSCLGYSPTGETFNLEMEDVATQTAQQIGADKLIFFTSQAGLMDQNGQLIRELAPQQFDLEGNLQQYNNADVISALRASYEVCQNHVERAHLISYQDDGALIKELFTRDGNGTLVSGKLYERIRQASIEDVGGILQLIRPLEENGTLVRRSRELLETEIERFTIIERDGMIVGCAALYPFANEKAAEVACVAVHPDYRHQKRGDLLLAHLEKQAMQWGIGELFVLTTRTAHWFVEKGFTPSQVDELPESKQTLYNWQRNSKTFKKILS